MAEEVKVTSKSTNSVDILGLDDVKAKIERQPRASAAAEDRL